MCQEDPLGEETATHSSILAWESPWTEEPGWLQFMVLQRVGHDSVTKHACIIKRDFADGVRALEMERLLWSVRVVQCDHKGFIREEGRQ